MKQGLVDRILIKNDIQGAREGLGRKTNSFSFFLFLFFLSFFFFFFFVESKNITVIFLIDPHGQLRFDPCRTFQETNTMSL